MKKDFKFPWLNFKSKKEAELFHEMMKSLGFTVTYEGPVIDHKDLEKKEEDKNE